MVMTNRIIWDFKGKKRCLRKSVMVPFVSIIEIFKIVKIIE